MEWLGPWLIGLLITSAVCMLLELLCVSDSLRGNVRLAGGIILAMMTVSPLMDIDMQWIGQVQGEYQSSDPDAYINAQNSTTAFIKAIVTSHSGYADASVSVVYAQGQGGVPLVQAITVRGGAPPGTNNLLDSIEHANGLREQRIKDALVRIYGISEEYIDIR